MIIKAIGFDIDGTLYPNYRMYFKSIPFYFKNIRNVNSFSRVRRELRKIRPIENFRALQVRLFAGDRNISLQEADRILTEDLYLYWNTRTFANLRLFRGVRTVMTELKNRGYKIGLLSDFPVKDKIELLGLADLVDCSLSAEDIGYLKPAPEPFRALSAALAEKPEEILYIGNNYHYDIEGARQLGMHAAHITGRPRKQGLADFSFSNYSQFMGKFEKMLRTQ